MRVLWKVSVLLLVSWLARYTWTLGVNIAGGAGKLGGWDALGSRYSSTYDSSILYRCRFRYDQ
jgi:hypothetical protein